MVFNPNEVNLTYQYTYLICKYLTKSFPKQNKNKWNDNVTITALGGISQFENQILIKMWVHSPHEKVIIE